MKQSAHSRGPLRHAFLAADLAIHRLTQGVLIVLMVVMFLTLLLGVVARYYRQTFVWSQEVAELSFVWATFLGTCVVYRERGHIALELLGVFSRRLDRVVGILSALLCAVFFALLVKAGLEYSASHFDQRSTVLHLAMGGVYAVIPLAGALMLVHTMALLLEGPLDASAAGAEPV